MSLKPITFPVKILSAPLSSTGTRLIIPDIKHWDGNDLTSAELGTVIYAVLQDFAKTRMEIIELDASTVSVAATTGILITKRALGFAGGTVDGAETAYDHSPNETFVMLGSNPPQVYSGLVDTDEAQTITGVKTFTFHPRLAVDTDATDNEQVVTLGQLNRAALGTTLNSRLVADGTAGETLAAGNLVYFKAADARWWLADADTASTVENVLIGFAQGAGTAGNAVENGVLIAGKDSNQSGLVAGTTYYASQTAGAITATPPTSPANAVAIGYAKSATEFIMDVGVSTRLTEDEKAALAGTSGTPSATNKFVTNDDVRINLLLGDGSDGDVTISSPTTLARTMNYDNLTISSDVNLNGYFIRVKGTLTRTSTAKFTSNGGNGGNGGRAPNYGTAGTAGTAGAAAGTGPFANLAGLAGVAGVVIAPNPSMTTASGTNGLTGTAKTVSLVPTTSSVGGNAGGLIAGSIYPVLAGGTAGATVSSSNIDPLQKTKLTSSFLTMLGSVYQQGSQSTSGGSGSVGQVNNNGAASSGSGGSGAPGGIAVVICGTFVDSGSGILFQCNGGSGGNGGATPILTGGDNQQAGGAGAGAGGAGGAIIFCCRSKTATITYEVNGGAGGTGGGKYGNYSVAGGNGDAGVTGNYTELTI